MPALIYGTRRSALKTTCLRQAIELTARDPASRALLIVPEQTKMAVEQAYLELSATPGLMQAEVFSFRRLAWRLLGEVGRQPLHPIDTVGRAMLIYRVLRQEQNQLHAFASLAEKPGFVDQVAAVLGDLKRYRIDEAQLLTVAAQIADKTLREKSEDLARVLASYNSNLDAAGLTDAEDDLNRLADLLRQLAKQPVQAWPWPLARLKWLCHARVWISGFGELRDFTPQEDAVIAGLSALTAQLTLTVAADTIPADRAALDYGADLFHAGRRTAWRLQQLLPGLQLLRDESEEAGLQVQIRSLLRTGRLQDPQMETQPEAREQNRSSTGSTCRLHLTQAGSEDDELAWVAGEIRRLVQLEGYRYRDIGIAVSDLPGTMPRLRAVFREYGIPLFLDMERPLSGTPFIRYLLGLLDTGLSNWSRQALMGCLRSGLCDLSPDEIDRLENTWLARGLFRKDRLFSDQLYQDHDLPVEDPGAVEAPVEAEAYPEQQPAEAADQADRLLELRDRALLPLRSFLESLTQARDIREKVTELRRFLAGEGVSDRISRRIGDLADCGEMDAAVALAQSWNAFSRVLDQLLQLSAELPVSMQHFRDLLAAGINASASGVIPSAIDQVDVSDLRRSMLREPCILFLIGASAANIPPPLPPEGLLKDPDRQALSRLIGLQLPSNARDQAYTDAYVLETLLLQPSRHLYVTAPDASVSQLFRLLADRFPDCYLRLPECPDRTDARINAPGPAFRWLLAAQQPDPAVSAWPELARLLDRAGWQRPPAAVRSDQISSETIQNLYREPVVLSVSQLERYAACPFSHLAERLLALQRRPEWKPELTETGILLHGILELALQTAIKELRPLPESGREAYLAAFWQRWLQTDQADSVERWLMTTAERNRLNRLFDAGLNASVGRRIRQSALSSLAVIFDQLAQALFVPVDFEWVFGPEQANALPLEAKGPHTVWLRGKIDRVDQRFDAENGHFRIIDYKSGRRTVDYEALYHGLALQLPVYLAAYTRAHPGSEAEDAAWFVVNRPILTVRDNQILQEDQLRGELLKLQKPVSLQLESPDLALLCRHALKKASVSAHELLSGRFPVCPAKLPGRRPPCDFCSFQSFCLFDPSKNLWRRPGKPSVGQAAGNRLTARQTFLSLLREADTAEGEGERT